jgi:hypothetical protein
MMMMRFLRFHRALHILGQSFEGGLRAGGIVRFQRGLERGEIIVECAVIAEKLAQRIFLGRLGTVLHILLKRGQSTFGRRKIARLNGGPDSLEILKRLTKAVLDGVLILIRRRRNIGYGHNFLICPIKHLTVTFHLSEGTDHT